MNTQGAKTPLLLALAVRLTAGRQAPVADPAAWDDAVAEHRLHETLSRLARACPAGWKVDADDTDELHDAEEAVDRAFRDMDPADLARACDHYASVALRAFDKWRALATVPSSQGPAAVETCRACGHRSWSPNVHGVRVCGVCHPVADLSASVRWDGEAPSPAPRHAFIPLGPAPYLDLHAPRYLCPRCNARWSEVQIIHAFDGRHCPRCGVPTQSMDVIEQLVAGDSR